MNKERLMTVLIQPHVSEKAATATEKSNQYVFRVRGDASKAEVRQAVELMFEPIATEFLAVELLPRPIAIPSWPNASFVPNLSVGPTATTSANTGV